MLCKTMSLMFLIVTILAVTSVDGCGPPNPCLPLNCRFPSCDEFHYADCTPADNTSHCGWTMPCRCDPDNVRLCCHRSQCEEFDAMQNPALLGPGGVELTDFPVGVQPAAFGEAKPGLSVQAAAGAITGQIKLNFPKPFYLSSVSVTTSPASVTSFRLKIWYQGGGTEEVEVTGYTSTLAHKAVVKSVRISEIEVAGAGDLVLNLNLSIRGCLDPACEETGGQCLERLPGNDGSCVVGERDDDGKWLGFVDGLFYSGSGLSCNGKIDTIKCCRKV